MNSREASASRDRRTIVYIHQHFKHPQQGGGTRSWEFARRLAEDGFRVTVIAAGDGPATSWADGVKIVRVRTKYGNEMGIRQRIGSFIDFMVRASIAATKARAEIVIATSTPLTVAVPGLVASIIHRSRFVFEVRDLWPSVPARLGYIRSRVLIRAAQALERITYRRADHLIALSPTMREGILQIEPLARVSVVPNASDIALFRLSPAERSRKRNELGWGQKPAIVYAGSFGPSYRIPWLVRLAAASHDAQYQIIGAGTATPEAEALAHEAGLSISDLFPGKLPKLEVAKRVGAADIMLSSLLDHPALYGNSLNKVFDALAAGRPVLFNHGGWLSDLLVSSGAGWRLDGHIPTAAQQVSKLLQNAEDLEKASLAAKELSKEFDRDKLYRAFRAALLSTKTHSPHL